MIEKKYLPKNLKYLRKKHGETQAELAKALNRKNLSSPSDWERGKSVPDAGTLSLIANRYGVRSIDDLFDTDLEKEEHRKPANLQDLQVVPIVGRIAAGEPNYALEDIMGYMSLPPDKKSSEGLMYLEVTSDSMDRKFPKGSYVLVDTQANLENGDIGVIKINGEEATLKQVKFEDNGMSIMLIPQSHNPNHLPVTLNIEENEVHIVGKAVGMYLSI